MNTKCHFCGNKNFREMKTQYIYKRDKQFLIVDDILCEQYFKRSVLRQIEEEFCRIHLHGKKPKYEVRVPIEQFQEIVQYA